MTCIVLMGTLNPTHSLTPPMGVSLCPSFLLLYFFCFLFSTVLRWKKDRGHHRALSSHCVCSKSARRITGAYWNAMRYLKELLTGRLTVWPQPLSQRVRHVPRLQTNCLMASQTCLYYRLLCLRALGVLLRATGWSSSSSSSSLNLYRVNNWCAQELQQQQRRRHEQCVWSSQRQSLLSVRPTTYAPLVRASRGAYFVVLHRINCAWFYCRP